MKHFAVLLAPVILLAASHTAIAQEEKSFEELVQDYELVSTKLDTSAPNKTVLMIFVSGQDIHRCKLSVATNFDSNVAYSGQGKWNIYCRPLGEVTEQQP